MKTTKILREVNIKFFLTTPILPSKTYFNSYTRSCKDIPYFNAANFLECTTTILLLTGLILFTKLSKCMFTCSLYQSSFQLDGEIEIDESLFGCKFKFHHGNPRTGLKVWIFSMVQRATNKILLFSVMRRTSEILLLRISKYIRAGSTIYSDGWPSYCQLNELGFTHFTVIHKKFF